MSDKSCAREAIESARNALEMLAAPAFKQRQYLESFDLDGLTDELALQFSDIFPIAMRLISLGELDERLRDPLIDLNQELAAMSERDDPAQIWEEESLEDHPAWRRVRELATQALGQLEAHLSRCVR